MTVKDLADKLELRVKDVLAKLLMKRLMLTINSTLDPETATMIAREFGDFRYAREHRLTVDAYSLQHPDEYMRSAKSYPFIRGIMTSGMTKSG